MACMALQSTAVGMKVSGAVVRIVTPTPLTMQSLPVLPVIPKAIQMTIIVMFLDMYTKAMLV